jgi:hypothetical protein
MLNVKSRFLQSPSSSLTEYSERLICHMDFVFRVGDSVIYLWRMSSELYCDKASHHHTVFFYCAQIQRVCFGDDKLGLCLTSTQIILVMNCIAFASYVKRTRLESWAGQRPSTLSSSVFFCSPSRQIWGQTVKYATTASSQIL